MYDLTNGDEDKFYSVTHFTFYVLRMAKASLETFDGGDFQEWRERLECYFCANDIGVVTTSASAAEKTRVERKMTAHLISHLSKTIYSTLKTLCLPNSPADLKYSVIAAKLEEHYRVKSSRTTATHHFRQCVQKPSESITDYSLRLQRCAVDCKFGAYLDRALCDQFVSGVRVMAVRKVILSKPDDQIKKFEEQVDVQVLLIDEEAVLNADCVAKETKADPTLSQVLKFVHGVWPTEVSPELRPYYNKRFALSVSTGVLILDSRVIVPESLRPLLLRDLHSEHSGIVRMKRLARKYIWWPRLDSDIEETVSSCHICQSQAKCPPKVHGTWTWPSGPWKRLHIDFAGPYLGKMFLVIVDAHSKYLDVVPMTHATTSGVISALRQNFSIFGLPEHIVSDNGSQFTSADFQHFLSQNGIFHTKTAPGHPATNGLAERYVGFFKSKMSALSSDDPPGDLSTRLSRFLFSYRSTPNSTGRSPAELLTGRQPRTRFDLLQPSTLREQVRTFEDNLDHSPRFAPGDPVFALSFSAHTPKWVPAVVTTVISPMNYKVRVDETVWKRHRDQLRPRTIPAAMLPDVQLTGTAKPTEGVSADVPPTDKPTEGVSAVLPPAAQRHPSPPSSTTVSDKVIPSFSPSIDFSMESSTSSRPKRTIRKPGRYDD